MGQRQAAELEIGEDRLNVAVRHATGRGIAVMADGGVALQLGHDGLLAKDISHQARGAVGVKMTSVVGEDAGGFLAPMLERMEAKGGMGCGIRCAVDPEQRTLVLKLVEGVVEGLGGVWHGRVISGVPLPRHQGYLAFGRLLCLARRGG